jgi:serine/threonine protein kinase/Flp pilus assembly protein TadD
MRAEQHDPHAIFNEAIALGSPEAQALYLNEACGTDTELRKKIEALLRAHSEAGGFFGGKSPAPAATEICFTAEKAGTVIGPYKLLQQIGEGGMGVVYMAEQTVPVERRVALKIIKPGMDTQLVIARFEAERQALAMMDHPNIARVLDAGTTATGRPYFVMELVKGLPITQYCDEQHLSPRERLELFVPICQAVQHAHQKGIIHRDLKPSNILIARYDDKPVPKVIDFGVAKATSQKLTERTMFTQFGQLVGTIDYMSPEQAQFNQLDVDTRSDIYSLGVLLYELLTGETPFDRTRLRTAAFEELLRIIREEEPPRPSVKLSTCQTLASVAANRHMEPHKLGPLVRGELDWIVMKALEKDRNRRYETANGFAADVQRYLNDEPVQACPPSATYRFRKMARRNKRTLVTVTVLLFAVFCVVGAFDWAVRDRVAREAAVQAEVDLALQEAEQWQEQAKWLEALSAAKRAEGLLAGSKSHDLREQVRQLQKELELVLMLEAYRTQRANLVDRQTPKSGYPGLFTNAGIDVENMSPAEVAAQISRRPGTAIAMAGALDDWAQETQDEVTLLRLLEAARLADSDPWRRQLRQLVGKQDLDALRKLADEAELSELPVQSVQLMGNFLAFAGDTPACIAWLRRAHQQHPGDSRLSFDLALHLSAHSGQGNSKAVDLVDALRFAEAALASRPSPDLHQFVGNLLLQLGRHDEAIASARQAIEIAPDFNWDNRGLAEAYRNLGDALAAQQKPAEAIPCFRKSIELKPTDWAYNSLGWALAVQGNLDEAINYYHKSIELNPEWDWPHCNLGDALASQGKLDDAIHSYRKAIELDPEWSWPRHRLASVLDSQAWALATYSDFNRHDPGKAVRSATEAVELVPTEANYWNTLGVAQYRAGHWQEAISALQRFRELRANDGEWSNPLFLAMAHWQLGNKDEAHQWFDKGIAWMEKNQHPEDLLWFRAEAAGLLGVLSPSEKYFTVLAEASVLRNAGHWQEAIDAYSQAIDLAPVQAPGVWRGRGSAYLELRQWDLAKADWLQAIELQPDQLQSAFDAFRDAQRWTEAAEFGVNIVEQKKDLQSWSWLPIAAVLARAADQAQYADFCDLMLQRFGDSVDTYDAERVTKVCLLRPNIIAIRRLPSDKFTKLLDDGTAPDDLTPWGWATRALLAYRSGNAKAAAAYVSKSEESNPIDVTRAMNLAVLAMAKHQLQHAAEARTTLEASSQLLLRLNADPDKQGEHDVLIADILFREAAELLAIENKD